MKKTPKHHSSKAKNRNNQPQQSLPSSTSSPASTPTGTLLKSANRNKSKIKKNIKKIKKSTIMMNTTATPTTDTINTKTKDSNNNPKTKDKKTNKKRVKKNQKKYRHTSSGLRYKRNRYRRLRKEIFQVSDKNNHQNPRNKKHLAIDSISKHRNEGRIYRFIITKAAFPYMMCGAIFYLAIGVCLFTLNARVEERQFDYTDCCAAHKPRDDYHDDPHYHHMIAGRNASRCVCTIRFELREPIMADVFVYYRIRGMYQVYMPYAISKDELQLIGQQFAGSCEYGSEASPDGRPIAPCGMIANSLFNDTFELNFISTILEQQQQQEEQPEQQPQQEQEQYPADEEKQQQQSAKRIPFIRTGITWQPSYTRQNPPTPEHCDLDFESQTNTTIHNNDNRTSPLRCAFAQSVAPKNWHKPVYELDEENDPGNNGYRNERLSSWMRVSTFGDFRKLYARIDHRNRNSNSFIADGLPVGVYELKIFDNYPVRQFGARKYALISNTSPLGGRNFFIAYLYLAFSLIYACVLTIFYFTERMVLRKKSFKKKCFKF